MTTRVWGLAWLAAAMLLNSGCAIYSETRDKQGQELKAAWDKVSLQVPVETSRKNFAALLEEQMKFEDELWMHSRSLLAEQMLVSWDFREFKSRLERSLKAVVGTTDTAQVTAIPKAKRATEQAKDKLAEEEQDLLSKNVIWPGCEATVSPKREGVLADQAKAGLDTEQMKALRAALTSEDVQGYCIAANRPLPFAPGGELLKAQQAAERVKAEIEGAERERKEKVDELAAAAKVLTAEQQKLAPGQSNSDALTKAKTRFENAVKAVASLQSATGQAFLAQEELDTANEFLTTYDNVVAGKGAPEGSNRLAIALALFPDLASKAQKASQDLEKPNLVPFMQQKQLAQAKLAAAERDVQRQQTLLQLHQTRVDQLMARLEYLNRARASALALGLQDNDLLRYALVPEKQSPLDKATAADQKAGDAALAKKKELWRVAALFLYAEGNLRAEVGKTRQRILAANYERSIDYAESGLAQWKALLDPSVELMAEYGKSGTRVKDIQDFLNTVALFWIAVETGK